MKRMLLFFCVLTFFGTSVAAEIGVIAQFPDRRPALNKIKGTHIATGDVNGDGISEISVIQGCSLKVVDPVNRDLLWEYCLSTLPGNVWDDTDIVHLLGFVDFSGETHAIISIQTANGIIAILIAIKNNQVAYLAEERIVSILRLPNGRPAIATFIEQDNIFNIVGEMTGSPSGRTEDETGPSLSQTGSSDYVLATKFQGEPGLRLAYDPELFDPRDDMDINGDGWADIPVLIRNQDAQLVGMVVRGGDNLGVLWQFPFPQEHRTNILKSFHGFVDVNGDGEKEAIFGANLAVTLDGTVHTIAEDFVTLDVNDVDNDGFEDIIGLNTTDSTVVVYGAMTATSVENSDPENIHFQLFQNYPNPFNPNTTISYSVAQTGEVKLKIFNTRGQVVRTLVSATQGVGQYSLTWDGRDDTGNVLSSGQYFYRLKVGEASQTRRMLFLK